MTAAVMSVPTNRRERLLAALRIHVDRPTANVASDPLTDLLFEVLRAAPPASRAFEHLRFLIHPNVDQNGRRRLLAFLFDDDRDTPFAFAKVQSDTRNGSLQTESAALTRVHGLVTPELRKTIPVVLRAHADSRGEVLVTSALPGLSVWLEMQASLLPSRHVPAHFAAAARWLAAFHEATRQDEEITSVHGDFWAHNILHDASGTAVVDWEHFSAAHSRYADLFHYPLTYGQAYPWRFYRRVDAETAFAKTFLERNHLSRAVRAYLDAYCADTGIRPPRMAAAFRELLANGSPHPGVRNLPWARFLSLFDASRDSVFS
jgi:hypothetical protein